MGQLDNTAAVLATARRWGSEDAAAGRHHVAQGLSKKVPADVTPGMLAYLAGYNEETAKPGYVAREPATETPLLIVPPPADPPVSKWRKAMRALTGRDY